MSAHWFTASVRGVATLVGRGIDAALSQLAPALGHARQHSPAREALRAALNGVVGDYLAHTGNPLAIELCLRRDGIRLPDDAAGIAEAIPDAGSKVVVLVHGLCMNDLQWRRNGRDYGGALARDLGYTPLYLHYNSGRAIAQNGRAFAECLERAVRSWPRRIDELVLIGHSMGGLVARSACRHGELADHQWRRHLRRMIFIGTPHHGAPLERGGGWIDALLGLSKYSAPLARLGKLRSAGITDLRYGNVIGAGAKRRDRGVPLPADVDCYAIGAVTGATTGTVHAFIGDGMVPLDSALGRHRERRRTLSFGDSRQWVAARTHHLELLGNPKVYGRIRDWLSEPRVSRTRRRRRPA